MSTNHAEGSPVRGFDERDWTALLEAIRLGECTPFLGAGACGKTLLTSEELARKLASVVRYPLSDWDNLSRVSQFAAQDLGPVIAKCKVLEILGILLGQSNYKLPHFSDEEPHSVLAQLPMKLYITTNYDDYMYRALRHHQRNPDRQYCRWYDDSNGDKKESPSWKELSVERPLVFHLHGSNEVPASLVVTEDDYLDFMMNIGRQLNLVPPCIQGAIARSSLLFIGYGLRDWDFRVLHRSLVSKVMKSQKRPSFTVQLPPLEHKDGCTVSVYLNNGDKVTGTITKRQADSISLNTCTIGSIKISQQDVCHVQVLDPAEQELLVLEEIQSLLAKYHRRQIDVDVRIFWGTAQAFVNELSTRCKSRIQ